MKEVIPITKGSRTRLRILMSAMELFNTKGFRATRISDIIEASGVQKGNLYFYFRSKEELALALINEAHREYLAFLRANATGDSALEKIDSILNAILEYHAGRGFVGGCIFGNVALEMGDQSPEFRRTIRGIFDEWTRLLAGLLDEASLAGELVPSLEPDTLARHIVSAIEGGIMLSRMTKDKKDMLCSLESIRALLRGCSGTGKPGGKRGDR